MDTSKERDLNEAAYRQLKDTIATTYPHGQYVAIFGGKIIADAPTFRDLDTLLHERGIDSPDVLVVEAGVDYPEFVMILAQSVSS
jgi:hypothetical protein